MANSVGASSSGCKHDVAGESHGAGSSLGRGSSLGGGSSHKGRRENDSSEEDKSGHDKGSPVLLYKVPAPRDDCTTPSDSDTDSSMSDYPRSSQGDPTEFSTEALSGILPYFEVELVKTHVAKRYRLLMPRKATRILPAVDVAVTLRYGHEEWKGTYHGSYTRPVISKTAWQPFVEDNRLKAGDICTFELQKHCDTCGVRLKVLLLKGPFDTPEERLARRLAGTTPDHAIVLD